MCGLVLLSMIVNPVYELLTKSIEKEHPSEILETTDQLRILTGRSINDIKVMIERSNTENTYIGEVIMLLQHLGSPIDTRRQKNKQLVFCLKKVEGSLSSALIWMKNNLYQETSDTILDDYDFSGTFRQKLIDSVRNKAESVTDCFTSFVVHSFKDCFIGPIKKYIIGNIQDYEMGDCPSVSCSGRLNWRNLLIRLRMVVLIYFDLVKDLFLLVALMYILQRRLIYEFFTFASFFTWILAASILLPLIFSALEVVWCRPSVIFGHKTWLKHKDSHNSKFIIIKVLTFLFYFTIPALLLDTKEEVKAERKKLLHKGKLMFFELEDGKLPLALLKKLKEINNHLEEIRLSLLSFRRHELSIEVIIQVTLQVIMILLSPIFARSPTNQGLQALFQGNMSFLGINGNILLGLSIGWSLKCIAMTSVKVKAEQKLDFLPMIGKVLLAVHSLFVYITRIFSIIIFFTPFLNLFNILAHWAAEQTSLEATKLTSKLNQTTKVFNSIVSGINKEIQITSIHRSDYTDPKHPIPITYSAYTVITLGTAFRVFLAILLCQAICIFLLKKKLNNRFSEASWTSKLQHLVETVNMPDCFSDWEEGEGGVKEHKRRRGARMLETVMMILIQFGFNLLMAVPLWITGESQEVLENIIIFLIILVPEQKVAERHFLLLATIGVYQEETDAYNLIYILCRLHPIILLIFTLTDILLVHLYQTHGHPWARILKVRN